MLLWRFEMHTVDWAAPDMVRGIEIVAAEQLSHAAIVRM
jgi:hypothetical protein